MDMVSTKRGEVGLGAGTIRTAIIAIVMLVVLFKLYASLVPEAQSAGNELNSSGVPLGSLFTSNGVVFIIIMVALIIVIISAFLPKKWK
jgi:hypothetical protein